MIYFNKLGSDEKKSLSLDLFNEDELKYICDKIMHANIINYFKYNSRSFNKIRPGFRPDKIPEIEAKRLIITYARKSFITNFLENTLKVWLNQIENEYKNYILEGYGHVQALMHTLPDSVFFENVELYFKIIGDDYTENEISILSDAITIISNINENAKKQGNKLSSTESALRVSNQRLKLKEASLKKTRDKISVIETDLSAANHESAKVKNLKNEIEKEILKNKSLEKDNLCLRNNVLKGKKELEKYKNTNKRLQAQLCDKKEMKELKKAKKKASQLLPKHPNDMMCFKEALEDNIASIGVSQSQQYFGYLIEYIINIAFDGVPIISDLTSGINIAKCISNSLVGEWEIDQLDYIKGVTSTDIDKFLLSSGRVVCLNGFIGNFNETELIPLLKNYKAKIIFITTMYSRTLNYVSNEILRYCHYINTNRIPELAKDALKFEESSIFIESEFETNFAINSNRYSKKLQSIMNELGYSQMLIQNKKSKVTDESSLIQLLAFDVLPYSVDVLHLSPFNESDYLLKYTDNTSRFILKDLFKEWFIE